MSLNANNEKIPVIGFSWDSNTNMSPSSSGWRIAKFIADQNGPKLAQFILKFKAVCPNSDVRLIAHSLGARVVESALISLDSNQQWKSKEFKISYVHLMGPAINNKATASITPFGIAIGHVVDKFYTLYDPQDILLRMAYKNTEHQDPLGLLGLQKGLPKPEDYIEQNVEFEIPPFHNANGTDQADCGDKLVAVWGDNHCGYMGFRYPYPSNILLRDDGAINIVVRDWKEITTTSTSNSTA